MTKEFFNTHENLKIAEACVEAELFGMHLSKKYGAQPVFHAFAILLGAWTAQQNGDHLEESISHVTEAMREGFRAQKEAR